MRELPMVFGTETEFGFSFGEVLNEATSRHFPENFLEKFFYLIIKAVAEKMGAFTRQPEDPWERGELNHLDASTLQKMTETIISGKPDDDLPKQFLNSMSFNASMKDIYFCEVGIFLPNGSRLYLDGPHLEYSISECRDPYEVVCQEKAMERILAEVILELQEVCGRKIFLFKNNTDFQGNSYACHSNYLLRPEFFNRLYKENIWSKAWLSFIATSIIYLGSGKVGYELERENESCFYQISQRADHMFRIFGMDTMHDRPMINLRRESLADPHKWQRFHVILDDSNMSDWQIYLKLGTKALVLNMLQEQYFETLDWWKNDLIVDYAFLSLEDPVEAMKFVSRDLTCKKPLPTYFNASGRSALEIQKKWLDLVENFYSYGTQYGALWIFEVIEKWRQVLKWLEDESPILDSVLDWRIKKRLIDSQVERRLAKGKLTSEENRRSIDLHYHDITGRGLYNRLLEPIKLAKEDDIAKAITDSSEGTRAWFRSQFIKRFPERLIDVSWELIVFSLGIDGFETRVRLDPDPLAGTKYKVGQIFEESKDYEEFCRRFMKEYLNRKESF